MAGKIDLAGIEHMYELSGELRLRPTRIGFLLRPTDKRSLRRIMRLCACLWGGTYNPLIPVCRALPNAWREPYARITGRALAQGYIRFFEPDVYVEAQPGLATECGIDTDPNFGLRSRVVALDDFVTQKDDRMLEFAFGLSIFDVYRDIYAKEYRFESKRVRKVVLFEGRSADATFLEAVSGAFPNDENLGYLRQAYLDAFEPDIQAPNAENWINALKSSAKDPLSFTRYGIDRHPDGSWNPCVFVADPRSPLDILDLWNLRQFHGNVVPMNVHWLLECKDLLREFIERTHRPLPGNEHGVTIRTLVEFGRSIAPQVSEEVAQTILKDLPPESWSRKLSFDPIWELGLDDVVVRSERATIEAKSKRLNLSLESESEPRATFSSLTPEFAERFGENRARWVNVVRLTDFFGKAGLALTLPSTPRKLMSLQLRLGEALVVSREGFVLPQEYKDHRVSLRLFRGLRAITEWLHDRGIESSRSDSGRVTDQVLNAVNGLRGAHVLRDAETVKLLDKMSKSVRTHLDGQRVEEYPDRTADVSHWSGIVNRRKKQIFAPRVDIQSFVDAGALRLGLTIKCANCEYENWYGIGQLVQRLTCERCLRDFDFPQGTLNFSNTPWRYRVTGPFSVPNYANGAYSTVLALGCLAIGLGYGTNPITYSSNLNLDIAGESIEIDFACWYAREQTFGLGEEPLFVVGETKSFAEEAIGHEVVRKLKLIGATLPGTALVIAVLKDELSDNEKLRIGRLALWGREPLVDGRWRSPVVVLTGSELFAGGGVQDEWKELGGLRRKLTQAVYVRMDNLVTLADLTQQVYLDLPNYRTWLEEHMKERLGHDSRNLSEDD